jgi:hypothetical protein
MPGIGIPYNPLIGGGIPGPTIMLGAPCIRFGKGYYLGWAEASLFSVTTLMSHILPNY